MIHYHLTSVRFATLILAIQVVWLAALGCTPKEPKANTIQSTANSESQAYQAKEETVVKEAATNSKELSGKVVDMRGLDGCQFLIELGDGRRLQAINLANEFKVDGLEISFRATPASGVMSICMAGEIVRVSDVKRK